MLTWEKKIGMISKTTVKYPPERYSAVARAIQSEWRFLQHTTWETENAFESFQLQMEFSFPFLRANDLHASLLNIRARSFLLSFM